MIAHSVACHWKRILLGGLLAAAPLAGCSMPGAGTAASPAMETTAATAPAGPEGAASALPAEPVQTPVATAAGMADPEAAPGDAAAGNAAAPEGAAEGAGTQDAASQEAAALALAGPSQLLDSYRVEASFVVTSLLTGGAVHVASTQVQGAWLRTEGPFGFDAAFTLVNSSGERREELGLVAIDDDAAVRTNGAWSTIRRDAALPYTDPDSLLSLPFVTRINRGENLGRERVGGVETSHYRLTEPVVFSTAVQDMLSDQTGVVRSVLLEGWVADAGFVVRYFLRATLADAEFVDDEGNRLRVEQQIDASYLLSDVDAVGAIEWPADAQPPETIVVPGFVPNTFPLPEGATATPHLGAVEIRVPEGEADVAAFYRARLAELGWDLRGELGFYSAAKGGQGINLTILPDEVSGETVVRVFATGD